MYRFQREKLTIAWWWRLTRLSMLLLIVISLISYRFSPAGDLQKITWSETEAGYVCSGDTVREYIAHAASSTALFVCPENHALFAQDDISRNSWFDSPETTAVSGACCRLPQDDILSNTHYYGVAQNCPENSVITSLTFAACAPNCIVRCTAINQDRYQLGQAKPAFYWSADDETLTSGWGLAYSISISEVPRAIREGIRIRTSPSTVTQDADGCVGVPFGSLLTGKSGPSCDSFVYRSLHDVNGKPVPMFPLCEKNPDAPQCQEIPLGDPHAL